MSETGKFKALIRFPYLAGDRDQRGFLLEMRTKEAPKDTEGKGLPSPVDKTLVAMFIKMSVEERLRAADEALRTRQELVRAFKQSQSLYSQPD